MNYREAVDYLYTQLPMYQRDGKSAYKKDLSNILALLDMLGNPQLRFKSIHVAGTNGKGTCSHGLASILQLSGHKTGLYTSPHLKHFTERIKVNGQDVDTGFVVDFVKKIQSKKRSLQPSFFEITVAMAFEYFASIEADIAVIETGLGGRLDSTNVIDPEACLITNIGYDHVDILGDTLEKIAREKAGIIKKNAPVVIGEYHPETFPVFTQKAEEQKTHLYLSQNYGLRHHPENLPYTKKLNYDKIKMTTSVLNDIGWNIPDEMVDRGIIEMEATTGLKGRCQIISKEPKIIADVAHNKEGLFALFDYIQSEMNDGHLHLIFGSVKEKDLKPILNIFPKHAINYWTQSSVLRSLEAQVLKKEAANQGLNGDLFDNVNQALTAAKGRAKAQDTIVITGSTFVVADLECL